MPEASAHRRRDAEEIDFFDYWDSMGFFEYSRALLPPQFFILFEIARTIYSDERLNDCFSAIEEITREDRQYQPDRTESIAVNRLERIAPVADRMDILPYRTIIELKKALPRELAWDDDIFDIKLLTKTLLVQRHYETEADQFKPISTSRDRKGKEATRFEQKFYILLDRSKSMESKMRTFYSKCIIADFLRRKYSTKAKIFYRPFDSKPGDLIKVERPQDFPRLIEEILYTSTGGRSTDIHHAVLQAISDITFDKEMSKSEILLVTDGISQIEKNELKIKLGDIKLNVLKIGTDIAMPDPMEMEAHLRGAGMRLTAESMDLRAMRRKMEGMRDDETGIPLTPAEKTAYRKILESSERMFKDLREVAHRYIEIQDLNTSLLYHVGVDQLDFISFTLSRFSIIDIKKLTMVEKKKLFRQVQFFYQYIQMLIENGNANNPVLQDALQRLVQIKRKMLKNPDLVYLFVENKELTDNRETLKMAKSQARSMLKQMKLDDRRLSIAEMKKAQLVFTMDTGAGSRGQLLTLLLVKLWEFLKRYLTRSGREARRAARAAREEEKRRKREEADMLSEDDL